jgi:predicted ATPase
VLVGRERELGEIEAALARAAAASGALFLLAGEPGIGKTRLAQEAANLAREQRVRVSWGRCWEAGGAPSFWPWREALEGLGLAFPDAGAIPASSPAEARFALFREVASSLGRAAAREPLLIVLEDLHAADASTLLLLELVSSQLRTLPIMLIGTYRDLEASLSPDAGDAIARISRAARVLHLGRLLEADVAVLVRDAIADADARLAASVYATTGGNPLFVDEIVREVRARGAEGGMPIPLGVREIIRQRLGLVAPSTRRVLEAAAVLGVELGAAEVERMAPGATTVLHDATRSGLVTARGERFRFSHALYREALYHDLPRAQRQELHREAARALAATGAPLAELAHHLLESGPEAVADAIDHAIRAAHQALAVFGFEDAVALLERARNAVPRGALETSLRARVLTALGEARIRSGDAAGRELCVAAAQLARAVGDATLLALAGLAYGAVFTTGGVDPGLVSILEEALALLPHEDSALRARVMARLAAARQPSSDRKSVV